MHTQSSKCSKRKIHNICLNHHASCTCVIVLFFRNSSHSWIETLFIHEWLSNPLLKRKFFLPFGSKTFSFIWMVIESAIKKKISFAFGIKTLFIHMNGFQILLFQNEVRKIQNFASLIFLGLMVLFKPRFIWPFKPSLVWPKPSFGTGPSSPVLSGHPKPSFV